MIKAKFYGSPVETVDFSYNIPINIYMDNSNMLNADINKYNILVLLEPEAIRNSCRFPSIKDIIRNYTLFKHIIAFNKDILEQCPNAVYWRNEHCSFESSYTHGSKRFGISAVIGCKKSTIGHKLRLDYYSEQKRIRIPTEFYISSRSQLKENPHKNTLLGAHADDKMKLFDTMFHLCIENSIEPNYITEKIVDCIQCKTVPVYYGCPNIADFLNIDGMLFIDDNVNNGIGIINRLSPDTYTSMISAVEDNYNKIQAFLDFPKRLHATIQRIIQ